MQLKKIYDAVENETGLDIKSKSRTKEFVKARCIYFKLAKELTSSSLEDIGGFVKRDHSTVTHGLKVFESNIMAVSNWYMLYLKLKKKFYQLSVEEIQDLSRMTEPEILQRNLQQVEEVKQKLLKVEGFQEIVTLITKIPEEDLREFRDHRLIPFLKIRKAI